MKLTEKFSVNGPSLALGMGIAFLISAGITSAPTTSRQQSSAYTWPNYDDVSSDLKAALGKAVHEASTAERSNYSAYIEKHPLPDDVLKIDSVGIYPGGTFAKVGTLEQWYQWPYGADDQTIPTITEVNRTYRLKKAENGEWSVDRVSQPFNQYFPLDIKLGIKDEAKPIEPSR